MLEAGGSSLAKAVKVNIFLADMGNFAAVNEVYAKFFPDPKPVCAHIISSTWTSSLTRAQVRTCVCVKSLPLGTDVEIECSGHL